MRIACAAALALLLASSVGAANITGYLPANITSIDEQTAQRIEVSSLKYPQQGVSADSVFEVAGTAETSLVSAACTGPSSCSCKIALADFTCTVLPKVAGVYTISLSSENASTDYYLELYEGRQVKLTSVLEAEPPSTRWPFYAMAGLGIVFLFYLGYAAYGRLTRKRRNIRQLLRRKVEIEHDMETLRYRYMKREIDEITLAQLMQQKKLELIQVQAELEDTGGSH